MKKTKEKEDDERIKYNYSTSVNEDKVAPPAALLAFMGRKRPNFPLMISSMLVGTFLWRIFRRTFSPAWSSCAAVCDGLFRGGRRLAPGPVEDILIVER